MTDFEDDGLYAWARNTDPDTAHEAADALTGSEALAYLQKLVCDALAAHDGLTVTEIARLVGQPRDTISPRMRPLEKAHRVEETDERRVPAGMKKKQIVWRLARPAAPTAAPVAPWVDYPPRSDGQAVFL